MILLSKFHKYFPAFQMMIILIINTSSPDQAKLSTNSISTHSRAVRLIWESNCMGHQNCRAALPIQPGMGAAILYVQMYTYTYTHKCYRSTIAPRWCSYDNTRTHFSYESAGVESESSTVAGSPSLACSLSFSSSSAGPLSSSPSRSIGFTALVPATTK